MTGRNVTMTATIDPEKLGNLICDYGAASYNAGMREGSTYTIDDHRAALEAKEAAFRAVIVALFADTKCVLDTQTGDAATDDHEVCPPDCTAHPTPFGVHVGGAHP